MIVADVTFQNMVLQTIRLIKDPKIHSANRKVLLIIFVYPADVCYVIFFTE